MTGSGEETLLFQDERAKLPSGWTPDGSHLLLNVLDTEWGIFALPVDPPGEPFPMQASSFNELNPKISPDGKWMAYASNESGRFEIYVTAFPQGGRKWQVSDEGGDFALWHPDGRGLYYLAPDGTLVTAGLEIAGSTLTILGNEKLYQTDRHAATVWNYDLSADGERFLISRAAPGQELPPLTLVVNWRPER